MKVLTSFVEKAGYTRKILKEKHGKAIEIEKKMWHHAILYDNVGLSQSRVVIQFQLKHQAAKMQKSFEDVISAEENFLERG